MLPPIQTMWRSWIVVGCLVSICAVITWNIGGAQKVNQAAMNAIHLFIGVLPNLCLGFLLAGFLHVLLPGSIIGQWMGPDTGFKGLLVGSFAGMITPGGPFTQFPILASFLSKGAGVGPVCAYITAWGLIGLSRFLVWELPILGPKVASVRFLVSLGIPPLIGWLGGTLYRLLYFKPHP